MPKNLTSQILERTGAVLQGHFVLKSESHADAYINKDAVSLHPVALGQLCRYLAKRASAWAPEVVVGPVVGGVAIGQWTAYHLTQLTRSEVLATFAEKDGDGFVIKRNFPERLRGRRTLVVEDILTTGDSARKVVAAARRIGANVVGVSALVNRGGIVAGHFAWDVDTDGPMAEGYAATPEFACLLSLDLQAWPADGCLLCAKGVPVNEEVGHGREFLAKQRAAAETTS